MPNSPRKASPPEVRSLRVLGEFGAQSLLESCATGTFAHHSNQPKLKEQSTGLDTLFEEILRVLAEYVCTIRIQHPVLEKLFFQVVP